MSSTNTHQVLFSYGAGGRAFSEPVEIGLTSSYSNMAVGLDGSVYVTAPSNTANRYLISARSSTATETYTIGSFGFTPGANITQRISSPKSVYFWNFGGQGGYFDELGDGTYYSFASSIAGGRGIIWTGTDNGYGGADVSTGLKSYKFDIGAATSTVIESPASNPLNFTKDHNPGSKIYCTRSDGSAILYVDTADDSINTIVSSLSPVLLTPLTAAIVASDGYFYCFRSISGNTTLERRNLSDMSVAATLTFSGTVACDHIYESPTDGRLWVRCNPYLSQIRMVGINKSTLLVEVFSEAMGEGLGAKTPLGMTTDGFIVCSSNRPDSSKLYYVTLAT